MANLKSLLDRATSDEFDASSPNAPCRKYYTCQVTFTQHCGISHNTDQCRHEHCFNPDPSVNKMTIEMWGGGGGGAGACCCQWGFSGGSGAYVRKCVANYQNCNQEMQICIGPPSCCSPTFSCGYRGCRTWVCNNYWWSNFCAEGGNSGCSFCFMFNRIGCGVCLDPRYPNCCACWFGGDMGVPGRLGGIATHCQNNNSCWYKHYTPLPGNLSMQGMRWDMHRFCAYNMPGGFDGCRRGQGLIGGGGSHQAVPGAGGVTASALGGNCYCGGPGGPGLVRITLDP